MFLRKCTVQRCHGQPSTWAIAAPSPSWQSETQRRTPVRPRTRRLRRNSRQKLSVLSLADVEADHLAGRSRARPRRSSEISGAPRRARGPSQSYVQPQVGAAALKRTLTEDVDLLIEAAAEPGDLVLAQMQPHLLDEAVDLRLAHAVDVGLLDDRDERLLGAPARMQEAGEVA